MSLLGLLIWLTCLPLCIVAYALYLKGQKAASDSVSNHEFVSFQRQFFIPYFMALFSDWLQGPYVYKLYAYYGYPQRDIAILYIVGFAASVTFGTATGPIADKFGRKRMAIIFCLVYSFCCLTKLSWDFRMLLLGRALGGMSTSILFSVFECWYIHEHTISWKYPLDWVSLTFSKATFFNGLLAIIAGVVAQAGSEWLEFGPVAPFMIAIPFLLLASVLIFRNWPENYGERNMNWTGSCAEGFYTIIQNKQILALGLVQSIFESNMYIFVFLWTPVLEPGSPPLGLTFSSFMVAIMIGSSLYAILLNRGQKESQILKNCLILMGVSLLVCSITAHSSFPKDYVYLTYMAFLALEVSVGLYFPCIARIRGEIIPDNLRANVMNWFRVPMNVMTCGGLLAMHHLEHPDANQLVFFVCSIFSVVGYLLSSWTSYNAKEDFDNNIEANLEPV